MVEQNRNNDSGNPMMQNDRLLRLKEVLHCLGVSRSTFYKGVLDGIYPRPVKIGERMSAWYESDIQRIVNSYRPSKMH